MPRKSTDSLSVAVTSLPQRPEPPESLSEYQAEVWRSVVNTKPVEWFKADTFPLLTAYCKAADIHRKLSEQVEVCDLTDKDSERLLNMQEKQARLIATLATKMRLTQQSRYTPQAASTADRNSGTGRKPWELPRK